MWPVIIHFVCVVPLNHTWSQQIKKQCFSIISLHSKTNKHCLYGLGVILQNTQNDMSYTGLEVCRYDFTKHTKLCPIQDWRYVGMISQNTQNCVSYTGLEVRRFDFYSYGSWFSPFSPISVCIKSAFYLQVHVFGMYKICFLFTSSSFRCVRLYWNLPYDLKMKEPNHYSDPL